MSFKNLPLSELCISVGSGISRPFYDKPEGLPVLRSNNVSDGKINEKDIKYWHCIDPMGADLASVSPHIGDVLVNFVNGSIKELGKAAIYFGKPKNCIVTTNFFIVKFDKKKIISEFANYFFQSDMYRKWLYVAAGFSGQGSFNQKDFSRLRVPTPAISEQHKIVEILRTWDEAIEKLEALRAAKDARLDGLRAALLFGMRRLNGHHRIWATRHLSELTHELTARNGNMMLGRDVVMGVTNAKGLAPMREQTIAEDIRRYKRLPPRAFAYNPMRINVGSIAMNDGPEEVLVSPDYVVFGCNPEGLDPDYLDHLRNTHWWGHYVNRGSSGSVRKRTYYDDLAVMKLPVPEMDEQREILCVLNAARDEVTKTAKQIDLLTRQKRGLMQKLLTGKWRVAIDETIAAGGVTP